MIAVVETRHRAECYECGWWGDDHEYRSDAQAEAEKHDAAVDHTPNRANRSPDGSPAA